MTKKVLITLDRLKYPNCGLGRYSHDFGQTLRELTPPDLTFNFLLPKKGYSAFEDTSGFIKLSNYKKFFSGYMKQYDLIHITHQLPNFKFKTNVKIVLTIHDINQLVVENNEKAVKYVNKIQKNINAADAVIFISRFTQQFCEKHLSLPENKVYKVIHNGINIPDTTPIQPAWFNSGTKYLFTIGQIMPKKNFHSLIPFLNNLSPDYQLIIAGEHSNQQYLNKVRSLIQEFGLQKRVHLPGSISEGEKRFLYEQCSAFLFPSLAEGFGMPVIEAMRFRKPVFSSDKCSLSEIGDQYAFFWQEFTPEYMAEIFNRGMKNIDQQHLDNAYSYSLKFSWETNIKKHLNLYRSLL